MCRSARLILLLVATSGTLLLLGTIGEAATLLCSQTPPGECRLVWDNQAGLSSSLLKIVVKDIAPTDPGGQNVRVRMCSSSPHDDRFQITLIRTGAPKDIQSCVNDLGSSLPCFLQPIAKAGIATADTLFLIIQQVSGGDHDNALIQITAPGWEDLQVFREDQQNAGVITTTFDCP